MKSTKIVFYISTVLLSLLMLFSAGIYIFSNAEVSKLFNDLGYPSYLVYPLAAAKLLGLAAIWSNYSAKLKEWAYAGFFFNFLLALSAHLNAGDGEWAPALMAIFFLIVSYTAGSRLDAAK